MKFGGSSVGDAPRILHVAKIIQDYAQKEKVAVVISAMNGVTNDLISIFRKYENKDIAQANSEIQNLHELHKEVLKELKLKDVFYQDGRDQINGLFGQFISYLILNNRFNLADLDYVVSFGEKLSSRLVTYALQNLGVQARIIDSSQIIITNNEFGNAKPLLNKTKDKVAKLIYPLLIRGIIPIITGYFGSTLNGRITTLGRGGSDYSATILAFALDAQEVILWKEVNGIFTGDPNKEERVKFLPELTYAEALALAQNGAKVLHPEAVKPIAEKEIIVWVKNTFNPSFKGSKIWKGIST